MRYSYIHIPKVAGSSFYNLIGGKSSVVYCGHIRAIDVKFMSFIRHPYDRLISAYFYLIEGGGNVEPDLTYQELLKKYTDFKDFVLNIEKDDLIEQIIHIKPMNYFLCNDEGDIVVEKIFKIEEIYKIDEFLLSLGYTQKLSEVHVNQSKHEHYTEYLDEEVIEEINKVYKLDFELFNYKML